MVARNAGRDLLARRGSALLLWGVPALAMLATGFGGVASSTRGIVWGVSLTIFGAACVANALRCGRVHCYFTGPFFLLMAAASLLHGLGIVAVPGGWGLISNVMLFGTVTLWTVPEWILGRYREA